MPGNSAIIYSYRERDAKMKTLKFIYKNNIIIIIS